MASLLGSCSWFESKPSPGEAAATGQPYPNLGTVPTQAPPTTSSADRAQVTQGLVADQQNAAYSSDQLKAQPAAGSVPPPAPATPPTDTGTASTAPTTTAPTTTASTTPAPAATETASTTPPASTTIPAPSAVEQSTLPPPPNVGTQTAAATTAPATVPYGTPMPATVPYGTPIPAPAAQPAAATPHYASPYYPIPVQGAPEPYAPAPVPGQTQLAQAQIPPAAGAPVIQDQARLAAILGAGAATLPGQGAPPSAATAQQPPIAVIFFRNGSVSLSGRDYTVLHDVMLLQQQQGGRLRVVGHASERTETTDYATHQAINDNLSLKRASAVGGALLQMGVPGSAVAITAVGGQGPVFYEFMPTGEAGNRRVEIFLDH